MHVVNVIVATFLIVFATTTAHPIFERPINTRTRRPRRIPKELLHHGALLPHLVRQSVPKPAKCTSQSDCTAKQECTLDAINGCKSGFCTGCTTSADCFDGQVCFEMEFGNFCTAEEAVCTTSPDCDEDLCLIQDADPRGLCVAKGFYCESDDDCTLPDTCVSLEGQNLGFCDHVCNNDSDCGEDGTCKGSTCVSPECKSDADCDDGERCSSGFCTSIEPPPEEPGCTSNDECEAGLVCDKFRPGSPLVCVAQFCAGLNKPIPAGIPAEQESSTAGTSAPATTAPATSPAAAPSAASTPTAATADASPSIEPSSPSPAAASSDPSADITSESIPEASPESSAQADADATAEPSLAPDADLASAVCVDTRALSGFERHELVFEQHVLSWVLCDANESCATAGHMVSFNGNAMMMNTYCDMVGCVKRRMAVNSPRYSKGLRVQSRTEGLQYTAFAARHGTKMEESALRVAVRVGL